MPRITTKSVVEELRKVLRRPKLRHKDVMAWSWVMPPFANVIRGASGEQVVWLPKLKVLASVVEDRVTDSSS